MKHILVTGSDGQLGLKIHDIAVSDENPRFIFCDINELDITKINDIDFLVQKYKIDVIINCAAYTNVDLAEKEEDLAYQVNAVAPKNLAYIANKYGSKLIHISTDYVFDGTKNTPYSEKDLTNPLSVYGKSKLDGEDGVVTENPEAIIIRTSWLYSEYGKNFAKTIINLGNERDFLKVVYDQVGTPTYAGDLADVLIKIVNLYIDKGFWIPGVYHFSNLGVCSWYDFALTIVKKMNMKAEVLPILSEEFQSVVKRPNYSVLNKTKIIDTYNLAIPYWLDACESMLKNYLDLI